MEQKSGINVFNVAIALLHVILTENGFFFPEKNVRQVLMGLKEEPAHQY